MTERLWTIEDVADYLGYKTSAVYQLVYYRRIPAIKISKKAVRFDPAEIKKWLAEKSQAVNPRPHPTAGTYRAGGGKRGRPRKNGTLKDDYINSLVEQAKKEVIG